MLIGFPSIAALRAFRSAATFGTFLFCAGAWSTSALSQDYPTRPIRLIVGFGAGGGTDILARIVAPPLGESLGQPVVVENRPGAGGTITAHQVATAAADGYTAFLLNNGHAVGAAMYKSLPYDAAGDFQPVTMLATMPLVVVAGPKAPYADLQALIAAARQNPGKLNFASVGVGSTQQFAGELFLQLAAVNLVHVPYKGTPNAIAAMQSGEAHLLVEVAASVLGQVRGGALKALAVTSAQRFPMLPDIPTVTESGIGGYDVTTWYALAFPAKTPLAIVAKMNGGVKTVLQRDDVRKQLANAAFVPETSTPEALAAHLRSEIARWSAVREKAKIPQQ
jgi:tripartite-type tricarboxylate transporter receptor subunit TctC